MMTAILCSFLASQHVPCEVRPTPEPPLAVGVSMPIVLNVQNGFVPFHLIPKPRFPVADAVVERVRCFAQNRPRLLQR